MLSIGGLAFVMICVFGGYMLSGGKFGIILHALPYEGMIIGGAAVGTLIIANSMEVVTATLKSFGKMMKGSKWKKKDFQDLLCLLFAITKMIRTKGPIAAEKHIEAPEESALFQEYPRILKDKFTITFICDYLRMMTMNFDDVHQVEEIMEKQLEKHHKEEMRGSEALQAMADALPALGIVAAVLGIIKTMSKIAEPPEILGALIGGALTGTFLGVLLAYGMVGPFATRIKQVVDDEAKFANIIRDIMVAHLHGNSPQISVEIGRQSVPSKIKPSFYDLEEALANVPAA